MSDHKFEKKVGQKLDDLKLTPSAKSWENIERELRRDKHRPAAIFWLPLLLLGLGASGYFMFTGGDKPNNKNVIAKNENKSAFNNNDENSELSGQQPEKVEKADEVKADETENSEKSGNSVNRNSAKHEVTGNPVKPEVTKYHESESAVAQRPVSRRQASNRPPSPFASFRVLPPAGDRNSQIAENTDTLADEENTSPKEGATVSASPAKPASHAQRETISPAEGGKEADSAIAATPKPKNKKSKKWSFGISASGGVSSLSEGKLSFNNSQIATVPINRSQSYSFASPAVVPPPSAPPSKIYPAFSFGLGLTTKYALSKRFALSGGVNYLQLNTISKVGYKFEQTNNQVYQGLNQDRTGAEVMYLPPIDEQMRDYDNKYHFIEVPLNLHTRLNKSEKLPVYWNAGISFSKLIKSNSLHYDEVEHLYYSNDELLKKTQTAISTGFSFVVFNKSSTPLWVGPTVRYNITQAFKNEIHAGNKHFMGLGLEVKWFLK